MKPFIPVFDIKVNISDRAKQYIKENGAVLTIEEAPQTGCCTNYVFVGGHLGKPDDEGFFRILEQDGIKIYCDPFILKKDKTYEVDLEGLFKWKTIVVY